MAVSSSSPADHQAMGLSFPVLSDPEGKAIRAYGVHHPGALPVGPDHVARPAELILDERRIVRKRLVTENWRIRERPERLLAELEGL